MGAGRGLASSRRGILTASCQWVPRICSQLDRHQSRQSATCQTNFLFHPAIPCIIRRILLVRTRQVSSFSTGTHRLAAPGRFYNVIYVWGARARASRKQCTLYIAQRQGSLQSLRVPFRRGTKRGPHLTAPFWQDGCKRP